MSGLVGNHIVGFPTRWLIYSVVKSMQIFKFLVGALKFVRWFYFSLDMSQK